MSPADAQTPFIAFLEPFLFGGGAAISAVCFFFISPVYGGYLIEGLLWIGILWSAWQLIREFLDHHVGVDVIALAAMIVSALYGEWITGIVILLMLSGGEALERYAARRARRHLTRLLSGVPITAHRKQGSQLIDIPVHEVGIGDLLVVKPGELVPVDGVIVRGSSMLDESLLTGEPLAVDKNPHDRVMGGSVNQGGLLEMHASSAAESSQYQRIVTLVHQAEQERAPFVRLADRYSLLFTIVVTGFAVFAWFISSDPVRVLAVLVVATPCPLILATPIALLSGMSRAAQRGVIIRNGGALEKLARVQALLFDKTGTLTFGTPMIKQVKAFNRTEGEILRIAASLDQASSHVLARSLVAYAKKKQVALDFPKHFHEVIGKGVQGSLDKTLFYLGRASFLQERGILFSDQVLAEAERRKTRGERTVFVASAHEVIGAIVFADAPRPGLKAFFHTLSSLGIKKVQIVTGDKRMIAERLARVIGIRSVRGECLPEDKVQEIKKMQQRYIVGMVGDGVNDAPALACADVGIAMGANGSGAAAESAEVIITIDEVNRVKDAYVIARETMHVAKTGIFMGIGLSTLLMVVAASGFLLPVYGAFLQEGIDVFVILYALRAARDSGKVKTPHPLLFSQK